MNRIVFLLEEESMKCLLDELLPRLFPDMVFSCYAHSGKSDLEKSIPKKLRAWGVPGDRFVVIRDKDRDNCKVVKQKLVEVCRCAGRPDTLVRIVCEELEAWYLGDPDALADAFGNEGLRSIGKRARFRDPDSVRQPAEVLRQLVPEFQKVSGARKMSPLLSRERNTSHSFRVLLSGLDRLWQEV